MSYYSPALEQYLANRKSKDQTKQIIKQMKKDVPVLSTIVDYCGQSTVDEILHTEQSDQNPKIHNNFQKILMQTNQSSQQSRSKKYLSFIDYKAEPSRVRISQNKNNKSKKNLKTSVVIQMPEQLKQLKNQILILPSIGQSRITAQTKQFSAGSRLLHDFKKSVSRRYQTQASVSQSRPQSNKKNYLSSLQNILTQFESPQINCNNHLINIHKECKKILLQQQSLLKQYKKFQSLGSPPKRIIHLKNLQHRFERTMDKSLDSQVADEINNMSLNRYDIVLKHQQQARKLMMVKLQQKKRQQIIEENKEKLLEQSKSDVVGFKLNSKGKLIYLNKNKVVK